MSPRAIFFDADTAQEVVARLAAAGYAASVVRESLAGEDDDEDQPWAVLSDAPEFTLDVLVEEYEGWLDFDEPDAPAATEPIAPLALPDAPRRIKRPDRLG